MTEELIILCVLCEKLCILCGKKKARPNIQTKSDPDLTR